MIKFCTRPRIAAALLLMGMWGVFSTEISYAEPLHSSVPWNGVPAVRGALAEPALSDPAYACQGSLVYGTMAGESWSEQFCTGQSSSGTVVAIDSPLSKQGVQFPGIPTFHQLFNCPPITCRYDPALDMLITRQHAAAPYGYLLVIYKHAHQRLQEQGNGYAFDMNSPDFTAWHPDGSSLSIGTFALSSNGLWLAMEIVNGGFGLMDLHTFQMKEISDAGYRYGVGYDPTIDLAVSNDGGAVAVSGQNVRNVIMTVRNNCGYNPLVVSDPNAGPPCDQVADAETALNMYQPGFVVARHPYFSEDGGSLVLSVRYWSRPVMQVTLQRGGTSTAYGGYIALGDSYSSGEGETDDTFYLPGTNQASAKCHTSRRAYPYLVASLQVMQEVHGVACSGAVINDIVASSDSYMGQGGRLKGADPTQRISQQEEALATFLPGEIPQSTFIDYYQPAVVTVGVGGNDAGFMDKIKACIMPDDCEWATPTGWTHTTAEIGRQFDRLVALYRQLHVLSPQSRIYAVGYPQIIKPDGDCGGLMSALLNINERQLIYSSISYMNMVMESAARKAGAIYIDTEAAYGNHVLCGSDSLLAVNGIQIGDDIAPSDVASSFKLIGNETFHPTPLGHEMVAGVIAAKGNLSSMTGDCGENICPEESVQVPPPPAAWVSPAESETATVRDGDIVSGGVVRAGSAFTMTLYPSSLRPGSVARIEIHSSATTLTSATIPADGSLRVTSLLPETVTPGYHVVHVIGLSYDDHPVDYYQTVLVEEPERVGMPAADLTISPPILLGTDDSLSHATSARSDALAKTSTVEASSQVLPDSFLLPLLGSEVKGVSVDKSESPLQSPPAHSNRWKIVVGVALAGAITMMVLIARLPFDEENELN